jgi:hypothetical protein
VPTFGDDLVEQQRNIADILQPDRIALNIGHRALASTKTSFPRRYFWDEKYAESARAHLRVTPSTPGASHQAFRGVGAMSQTVGVWFKGLLLVAG